MTDQGPMLYENFPAGCTDKQLKTAVLDYSNEITKNKAQPNVVLQCAPLIQLGLGELQGRFAKRTMCASLVIAFCSLIMSGMAIYLSIKTLELSQNQINESTENILDISSTE